MMLACYLFASIIYLTAVDELHYFAVTSLPSSAEISSVNAYVLHARINKQIYTLRGYTLITSCLYDVSFD